MSTVNNAVSVQENAHLEGDEHCAQEGLGICVTPPEPQGPLERVSFTLYPADIAFIRGLAAKWGLSASAAVRHLVSQVRSVL